MKECLLRITSVFILLGLVAAPAPAIMNGLGQDIFPQTAVFYSSATVLDARGVGAAQVRLAENVSISSETSAALGAGVRVSSNVYIVGFSSAAKYYGDGSGLGNISDTTKVLKAGDTMTGALTLPADPSSALQAAPKQYVDSWTRPCVNPGDANDIMVPVGGLCVDKYEASVWSTPAGGTQYGADGAADYPATCGNGSTGTGQGCTTGAGDVPIYARSAVGYKPSTSITWFQANIACTNAGKQLLTNAEWQAAAAGTPDPGAGAASPACKVDSTPDAASAQTGERTACVSGYGVENMIGSVWEWVADWGQYGQISQGTYVAWTDATMSNSHWPDAGYGADGSWNVAGRSNGSAWVSGNPAAVFRGGSWVNGALGGVFAFNATSAPSYSYTSIGFRCGRRR